MSVTAPGAKGEMMRIGRDGKPATASCWLPAGLARIPWWRRGAFLAGVEEGARETDLRDARP